MPIRQLNPAARPEAPAQKPSLWERIGGLPGVLAGGTRALTGVASAEGGPTGALISGLGEAGAETLEGSLFKQSPLRSLLRVGTAAGLGAVPFGAILKEGRPIASAARGALYSGGGAAATEAAAGQEIDPKAVGTSALLGGGLTGLMAKIFGKPVSTTEVPPDIIEPTSRGGIGKYTAGRGPLPIRPSGVGDIALESRTPSQVPNTRVPLTGGAAKVSPNVAKEALRDQENLRKVELWSERNRLAKEKAAIAAQQIESGQAGVRTPGNVRESYSVDIPGGKKSITYTHKPEDVDSVDDLLGGGLSRAAAPTPPTEPTASLSPLAKVLAPKAAAAEKLPLTDQDKEVIQGWLDLKLSAKEALAKWNKGEVPTHVQQAWRQKASAEISPEAPIVSATNPARIQRAESAVTTAPPVTAEATPTATYMFDQPGVGPMYNVKGGPLDRSTVSAEKLQEQGIPIPETTAPVMKPEAPQTPVTAAEPVIPPTTPSKIEQARATYPDEVNAELDKLGEQYRSMPKGPEKRAIGQQMAEIRDFFTPGKMRESWRGAPAEPQVSAAIPEDITPVVKPLSQKLEETLGPSAPIEPPVSKIGPSQTAKAREAAIAARARKKAEIPPLEPGATPPAEAKKYEALFNKLKTEKEGLIKGQKGEIPLALMTKLGLGVGGAAIGVATDEENRLRGAALGGAAGLGLAYAPEALASLGAHPSTFDNLGEKLSVEGIKTTAKKIFDTLPQIQRFNYLSSSIGLPANVIFGPYGSAVMGALEHGLSGDPRGWAALKTLKNPVGFMRDIGAARAEARILLEHGELGRAEGMGEGVTNVAQQVLEKPGIWMTAGDVAARRHLEAAGFTEAEARRMTLTSEPELQLPKALTSLGKGRSDATKTITNIIAPFRRTPANIWEQGMERFPGVGFWIQSQRDIPDPIKQQIMQQLLSGGVGAASAVAGANLDPETAKGVRRYLTNFAGQYSMPAAMGFAAGQAIRAGKPAVTSAIKGGFTDLPLPTTQPITEWANFLFNQGPTPSGAVPAFYKEAFPKTTAPALKPLPRLRRLR